MLNDQVLRVARVLKDLVPAGVKARYWRRLLERESRLDDGFHGDRRVMALANHFLQQSERFVETGAFAGVTSRYVARRFPDVSVHSCEPLELAREYALRNTAALGNVDIVAEPSPQCLYDLFAAHPSVLTELNTYWLDAHGYGFEWPLREEIRLITTEVDKAFVMIDDFKIPGRPEFGYDLWEGQVCAFDYIEDSLAPRPSYFLLYPTYPAADAGIDDLRGVGVIVVGFEEFSLPAELAASFSVTQVQRIAS